MLVYTHRFLFALVFTVFVEIGIVLFLIRKFFKIKDISSVKLLFSGFFASFATIPYVWFVFPVLIYWSSFAAIFWGEIFATTIEAIIYFFILKLDIKKSFFVSVVCNSFSFLLGLLITKL